MAVEMTSAKQNVVMQVERAVYMAQPEKPETTPPPTEGLLYPLGSETVLVD